MSKEFERLFAKLSEHGATGRLKARHDAASLSNPISITRVRNSQEFASLIGAFVNRQIRHTGGAGYPDFEARAVAREMLTNYGRRHGRTYVNYVRDAIDGRGDGLRGVLNILTDMIRDQQAQRYGDDAFDRLIDPLDFRAKVAITKEIMDDLKRKTSADFGDPNPEVHAHDYQAIVRRQVRQIDENTDDFRSR